MGSHSLLQAIFPSQGSNPGLPHCRWILYQLSHEGSPWFISGTMGQSVRLVGSVLRSRMCGWRNDCEYFHDICTSAFFSNEKSKFSMDMSLSRLQEIVKGQGSLVCCSPRGHKGSDMTWQLNNNNLVLSHSLRTCITTLNPAVFGCFLHSAPLQTGCCIWTSLLYLQCLAFTAGS